MCNLYSFTKAQSEVARLARAMRDRAGNVPPLPGIFPDKFAPVVRNAEDGVRELARLRWGMPSPPMYARTPDTGITNIRNTKSAHWRRWLKPEFRCVVPATSFCEPTDEPNPQTKKKDWVWFALSEDRPVFFFAGIWCKWNGVRGTKSKPEEGEHELFGFLTTDAAPDVKPIHSKATPVILTTEDEIEKWMTAPVVDVLELQRPVPEGTLTIVRQGAEKEDEARNGFPPRAVRW